MICFPSAVTLLQHLWSVCQCNHLAQSWQKYCSKFRFPQCHSRWVGQKAWGQTLRSGTLVTSENVIFRFIIQQPVMSSACWKHVYSCCIRPLRSRCCVVEKGKKKNRRGCAHFDICKLLKSVVLIVTSPNGVLGSLQISVHASSISFAVGLFFSKVLDYLY